MCGENVFDYHYTLFVTFVGHGLYLFSFFTHSLLLDSSGAYLGLKSVYLTLHRFQQGNADQYNHF